MQGKINKDGCLEIMRAGKWKEQVCPHAINAELAVKCGDWCPLFGEPEKEIIGNSGFEEEEETQILTGRTELSFCGGCLFFDKFTDEREGGK